jgi:hypothetical protein
MAKQDIYLGVEGNDGTGDSIREAFRKSNENFTELYAVFGQGGTISFTALNDTPTGITPGGVLIGNTTGTEILAKTLSAGTGISIDNTSSSNITITNTGANINADTSPIFGGPVSGNEVYAIGKIATSPQAIAEFNTTHGSAITINDIVTDKKFQDQYYAPNVTFEETKSVFARTEPVNASEYTRTIAEYRSGNLVITDHGYDWSINGTKWKYSTTGSAPNGLTNNTDYYVRWVNEDQLSLHATKAEAQNNDNVTRVNINIALGTQTSVTGLDVIKDTAYDDSYYGFYKTNEALPRSSAVRRQGDDMTGALYLHDHPGDLSGIDTGDVKDKQAATKLYVDNNSYSSTEDIFVTKQGDDTQARTPVGLEGRGLSYAYGSLKAALMKAEEVIESAPIEPGAYKQTITYNNGDNISLVTAVGPTSQNSAAYHAQTYLRENKRFIQKAVLDYVNDTFPNLAYNSTSVQNPNAEAILARNKKFIQEEVTYWINHNVGNAGGTGIWNNFDYSSAKCKRDVGYIVDAWINDLSRGGNIETRRMAGSYLAGMTNAVGSAGLGTADQIAQTNAAIEFAKTLVQTYVLANTAYTSKQGTFVIDDQNLTANSFQFYIGRSSYANTYVSGGTVTKSDTTVLGVNNFVYNEANGIATITTTTNHGLSATDVVTISSITVSCTYEGSVTNKIYPESLPQDITTLVCESGTGVNDVVNRANTLTTTITNVISNGLNALAAPEKPVTADNTCERDVGLIIDGMVIDIGNGTNTNFNAIQAATRYFSTSSGARARISQGQETRAAMTKAKAIVNSVVQNVDLLTQSKRFNVESDNLTTNTFQVAVGTSTVVHTYVSGGTVSISGNTYNISGFNYNNVTGKGIITTTTAHGRSAGDVVVLDAITFECTGYEGTKLYPTDYTTLIPQWFDSSINDVTTQVKDALNAKFDIILDILENGFQARNNYTLVEGSTYSVDFGNGIGNDSTDQGINTNVDILPGKIIVGRTSGARGRIVKYTSGVDLGGVAYDRAEVVLVEPREFRIGEELEYGNGTKEKQITVHVETGIYYEDYPLKVPANVSIKGSDFRRCQIRPAPRISQSPWANTYFYRDKLLDNLKITDYTGADLATPQAITITGSNQAGGVITVTPADNIAPIGWDGAWFYTDNGAVGLISNADGGSSFDVTLTIDVLPNLSGIASGSWHIKQTSNYGYHYLTDPLDSTSTKKTNDKMDVFLMNDATRLANMSFQGHGGFAQVLDPAGQVLIKSPYTQVCGSFSRSTNKQGFKGGMYIDGFAGNLETKITSKDDNYTLNVQSDAGTGLRIRKPQTPAPFFINGVRYQVDAVSEYDGGTGTAKLLINKLSNEGNGYTDTTFPQAIYIQTAGNRSMLANDYTQVNDLGYGLFCNNAALSEQVSTFTYYNHTAFFSNNGSEIRALNCSNANGNFGLVAAGSDPNETVDDITTLRNMQQPGKVFNDASNTYGFGTFAHAAGSFSVFVYDCDYMPYPNSLIDIYTATGVTTYEVTATSIVAVPTSNIGGYTGATGPTGRKGANLPIYRLSVSGDTGLETAITGAHNPTPNSDASAYAVLRMNKNHLLDDLNGVTATRPSTAVVFTENPNQVYRSISFNNQDADGSALASDRFQVVMDSAFSHLNLTLRNTEAALNTYAGVGSTMGATAGDVVLAIDSLTATQQTRINNNDMIFSFAGKTHIVANYTERTGYATIELNDLPSSNINSNNGLYTGGGLASDIRFSPAATRTIPLSLQDNEAGTITVGISTLRANGHDFDKIGTGGFNTTNYPSIIYGLPTISANQDAEVNERGKGRVFFASTDQDGFFRVGKFFSVDQGTGTVTFAASIAISNLDGLGFRQGVRITEFSNDDTMADGDPAAVPTEFAVEKFIEKRLHFDRDGSLITIGTIGPGAIARDGTTPITGNINAGSNKIYNHSDPTNPQDVTTKSYVDARTPFDTEAIGTDIGNRVNADILMFHGGLYDNHTVTGDVVFTSNGSNVATAAISSEVIVNGDVSPTAGIIQSKLDMQAATTRANATGIAQADLGLSAFDADDFTVTDGWVTLKASSVDFADLPDIAQNTVFARSATGTGDASAVTFADIVNTGGSFTTTGVADRIVKTGADGSIDAQKIKLDNYDILDQTNLTMTMKTPGGATVLDTVGTVPSNTTTTFPGSIQVGNTSITASFFQQNSSYGDPTDATLNKSRVASDWMYTSFIEAPGEKSTSSTGIGIGAGTGFSSAGEVAIVANNNTAAVVFKQAAMTPSTNGGYDIGTSALKFGTFHGTATAAQYADLAENYLADAEYEAGTVLVFGGEQEITTTMYKGDRKVAGVVSTNPAHLMNSDLHGDYVTALALQGRVPCKVIGAVEKGDIIVSSAIPGYGMVQNDPLVGTVIGKAVGTKDGDEPGFVEVVVGRV